MEGAKRTLSKSNQPESLGPLAQLTGTWSNTPNLPGRGWNMIALPFEDGTFDFRLLLNQYNEELKFELVDENVPNRGLASGGQSESDQLVATLDYVQSVTQIAVADLPPSEVAGKPGLAIHHEPGLWLNMRNNTTNDLNIARLSSIPHGNSVLALGTSQVIDGPPVIEKISGLPIGVDQDLDNPYLASYKHFHNEPFEGVFDPVSPNDLLTLANQGVDIVRTTVLHVDSTKQGARVSNIPFVVREANATELKSTFWIQELSETDASGNPKLRLQYTQTIMLDFFESRQGKGLIRWPHVSINTMEKVS